MGENQYNCSREKKINKNSVFSILLVTTAEMGDSNFFKPRNFYLIDVRCSLRCCL